MTERGLTVRAVGEMAGVGHSVVQNWLTDSSPQDLQAVARLARTLNMSFKGLLLIWMDPSIDYFRELFRLIVFCVRRVKTMSDFEMNATADQPDMRGLVTA